MGPVIAFASSGRLVYHQSKLLRNPTNQSAGFPKVKGLLTESTAQFPLECGLPTHFRQLLDSFPINQNNYEMPRTGQLVSEEPKLFQLRALPNVGWD